MKKYLLLIFSIVIAISTLCVSLFVMDNSAPSININNTPVLACNITSNDLLNDVTVIDDDLKSFFIEETDILQIAETGKLTYVAIDESNNVSRKTVDVNVDSDVSTYHIEIVNPLQLQINTDLNGDDYFKLKNECGWTVSDNFVVNGINNKLVGEYDVTISSRKHVSENLNATFEVDDFLAPKIYLDRDVLENYTHRYWNDEYFLEFVDYVEDDNDDGDQLFNKIKTNWEDAMNPDEYGKVDNPGTYTVTYSVTDSEGNTGKTTLKVRLENYVEVVGE